MKSKDISLYYIRCSSCNDIEKLSQAVLENWKVCNACHLVFCATCKKTNKKEEVCLGTAYTQKHSATYTNLPVADFLDMAQDFIRTPKEGKYISRIFYRKGRLQSAIIKKEKSEIDKEQFAIIRYREERWKKLGTVLVKRYDGKFITWGTVN